MHTLHCRVNIRVIEHDERSVSTGFDRYPVNKAESDVVPCLRASTPYFFIVLLARPYSIFATGVDPVNVSTLR